MPTTEEDRMVDEKISLTIIMLLVSVLVSCYTVLANDVSVVRNMENKVEPNSVLTVSFSITPKETISGFDLVDFVPEGWPIRDWSVSGYDRSDVIFESVVKEYQGKTRNANHWKFNKEISKETTLTLTYNLDVPVSSGSYEFKGVWTYPGGFNSDSRTLSVEVSQTTTQPTTTQPTTTQPTTTQPTTKKRPLPKWPLILVIVVLILVFIIWKFGLPKTRSSEPEKLWEKY